MTIYIDVVFLENIIINYIILYATGIVSKAKIKQIKLILSSGIGALYSVIYYIIDLKVLSGIIVKIILSVIMIYVGFNPKNIKILLKQIVLFYLVSFVFGGAAIAIIYMVNSQNVTIQNGVMIGKYTIKTILIGIIVAYITIRIAYRIISRKASKKDLICNVDIKLNNRDIKTKAMIDTGNLLKEPITNTPVVVVEHTLFYDIIPKYILNNLEKILSGDFSEIPENIQTEYVYRLKAIPFSSLGKQNGMLLGIKADSLIIQFENEDRKIENVIIGIYDKSLTKKGEYRALIGMELL